MAVNNQVNITVSAKDKSSKSLKSVGGSFEKLNKKVKKSSSVFGDFTKGMIQLVSIGATVQFGKQLLTLGSDLEEVGSKFNTVFSGIEKEAKNAFDSMGIAVGRSSLELMEFGSNLGDVLKPLGFSTQEAFKLSENMTKLAIDVASFNNVQDVQVINAFRSALTGERESLKSLGIVISEADLKTEAYTSGIAKQGEALSKTQKASATYNLLLKNSSDAQGDAVRTSKGFANQLKKLQGTWTDLMAKSGKDIAGGTSKFLGIMTSFLNESGLNILNAFKNVGNGLGKILGQTFSGFRDFINGVNTMFSDNANNVLSWGQIVAKTINSVGVGVQSLFIGAKGTFGALGSVMGMQFKEAGKHIDKMSNSLLDLGGEIITFDNSMKNNIESNKEYSTSFDKIKDIVGDLTNGIGGSSKKIGESANAMKKELKSAFDGIVSAMSSHNSKLVKATDEYKKLGNQLNKIKTDGANALSELTAQIEEMDAKIKGIEIGGVSDLAQRAIEAKEEFKRINEEIARGGATEEQYKKQKALLEEINLLNKTISAEDIEAQRVENAKSVTEKLIERIAIEKQEAELEKIRLIEEKEAKDLALQEEIGRVEQLMRRKELEIKHEEKIYADLISKKKALDEGYFAFFGEKVNAQISKTKELISLLAKAKISSGGSATPGIDGARANGGPVSGGKTYLVGEKGPELFTPMGPGNITPNDKLGGNSLSVNIDMGGVSVSNQADESRLADTIMERLTRELQINKFGVV